MRTQTADALFELIASRSKTKQTVRALLGDGTGTVAVMNTDSYVWIRPYGRDMPVRAYGPQYRSAPHDLPVRTEVYSLGARVVHKVVGVDETMYFGTSQPTAWTGGVAAHAAQHQKSTGGSDIVFISDSQYLPLLMYPTNPASTKVYIAAGAWWSGAALRYWAGGDSPDLSSEIPATGYARYVLLYIDDITLTVGFVSGDTFVDIEFVFPSPYATSIAMPVGAVPLGLVRLRASRSYIDYDNIFPVRNIIEPVVPSTLGLNLLMLSAQTSGLFKSTGLTWSQISAADSFMLGIEFVAIVDEYKWIVFRTQTDPLATDPLVYVTTGSGQSWEQRQSGISYTQGSDIWKVCAVWQSYQNPSVFVIVIANTTTDAAPQVFVTLDGAISWIEIDNTDLPVTDLANDEWPVSIGVESYEPTSFIACIAMNVGGLYLKTVGTDWVQKDVGSATITCVQEDLLNAGSWWATTTVVVLHTDSAWGAYTAVALGIDIVSELPRRIFQNVLDPYHVAIGADTGMYYTPNGADFIQYQSAKIGKIGQVVERCAGSPTLLFVTDSTDVLYISLDGGISSFQRVGLEDVKALAAMVTTSSDGSSPPSSSAGSLSLVELWLKG